MRKELIAQKDPKSPVSEVFRTLRTNIQFMNAKGKLKTLLVTSTLPGEGKSWVTSNLAVTFAQAGKRVILIDADMRKGRQYTIFGVSPIPGLSNYLSDALDNDGIDLIDYVQETEVKNLYIIPAGNIPPNPSELLTSMQMVDLLGELKRICDIVIIDGTPCELVTDSVIISRIVDSTIIVTASKQTKKDNLKRVISNIKSVGGNLAGVVLNKVPISAKKYEQSYYYGSTAATTTNSAHKKHGKNQEISKNRGNTNFEKKPADTLRAMDKEQEEKKTDAQVENNQNTDPNSTNFNTSTNLNNNITYEQQADNNSQYQENKQENNQFYSNYEHRNETLKNDIKIENTGTISLEKTNEILKQINEYIDNEKKNINE